MTTRVSVMCMIRDVNLPAGDLVSLTNFRDALKTGNLT